MPTVHPVATALPGNPLPQAELRAVAEAFLPDSPGKAAVLEVFDNGRIDHRSLAMPVPWYLEAHGFAERMAIYQDVGLRLAELAARLALREAGLDAKDITGIVLVSTTGIATPSLDARLCNLLPFPRDVVRVPLWGLGCAGGTAGLNRAADLARARPDTHVLLVTVELCSLAFDVAKAMGLSGVDGASGGGDGGQAGPDKKTMVAASLFADGAAACVVSGDGAAAPGGRLRHVAGRSHHFADTERVMGWDVADHNLEVVLSPRIPDIVEKEMPAVVAALGAGRIDEWVLHPGGAKVIDAYGKALGLDATQLRWTSGTLRDHGNMSSPSVLFALKAACDAGALGPAKRALLASLGPGFAAELCLLEGA